MPEYSTLALIAEINNMSHYRNEVSNTKGSVDYASYAFAKRVDQLLKSVQDIQKGTQDSTPHGLALEIIECEKFEKILKENELVHAAAKKKYEESKVRLYEIAAKIKGNS